MFLICGLLIAVAGVNGLSLRAFSAGSAEQTDADVEAFVNSCMGQMSDAAIGCPCARIGGRCRDSLSICDQSHHCKCDGSIGYLAASGTVCLPYPTTTTTTTPTTTACATCPTLTCPSTTTTTTLTTTTPAPAQTCTPAAGYAQFILSETEGDNIFPQAVACPSSCVVVTTQATFSCPTEDLHYPLTAEIEGTVFDVSLRTLSCPISIVAPVGKTLQTALNSIDVPTDAGCSDNAIIIDKVPGYCNDNEPTAPISINSNVATIVLQLNNEGDLQGVFPFSCQITVTAV